MVMWKSKKCPKCGGDMYIDVDEDVWFDHCLQCGYMKNLNDGVGDKPVEAATVDKEGKKRGSGCNHCEKEAEMCRSVR